MKEVCLEGGVGGRKSNHSLRATGASNMYQAGVPEKLIQERTGHLSTDGVRHYKRTTLGQQRAVSQVLSCSSGSTYQKQLSLQTSSRAVPVSVQPPDPMRHFSAPQMSFSGCNVTIYNAPLPPPIPTPQVLSQHDVLLNMTETEFQDSTDM